MDLLAREAFARIMPFVRGARESAEQDQGEEERVTTHDAFLDESGPSLALTVGFVFVAVVVTVPWFVGIWTVGQWLVRAVRVVAGI